MATAGSIVIDLLMRTGSFETDSKRAEKRLKQFKKEAEEAGKAIGVAVVAAGTAITALVKTSIDTMDELSKAAQRSNTTTEQFSNLAYGAGLADVSIQDLQGSLGKLAKAQGDALDAGSKQAEVFRALGIEVKNADGSLRDTTAVLEDFADRFQALKGSPEAVAAGMAIFGRSFQNLIPLIKDGSQGLRDAGIEAAKYGQVISTEAGQQAEQFNDNLTRMALYVRGVGNAVAEDLLPDLIELSDRFLDASTEGEKMAETAKGLADFIRVIGGAIEFAIPYFKAIDDVIQGATISMVGLAEAARGVINLDWDQVKRGVDVLQQGSAQAVLGEEKAIAGGYIRDPSAIPRARAGSARRGGAAMGGSGAGGATQDEIDAYTRKLRSALAGEDKGGNGGGGKSKAVQEAEALTRAFEQANEQLDRTIALQGNQSAMAQLNYELQSGSLKSLTEAQKQVLRDKQASADLIELEQAAYKRLTDESEKYADQVARATEQFKSVNDSITEQIKLIGMSADEQEIWNNLAWAGVDAESARGQEIIENTKRLQGVRDAMEDQIGAMDAIRGAGADFLADWSSGAKSFKEAGLDALDSIHQRLLQMIAENLMEKLFGKQGDPAGGSTGGWFQGILDGFFGNGSQGQSAPASGGDSGAGFWGTLASWAGSFFGGGRAGGGDVMTDRGYWVGEQGPEWFQPRTAGTVLPNGESMAMAGGRRRDVRVEQNFYNPVLADRATDTQRQQDSGRKAQRAISRNS
jgi:hypothetical protein